MRTLELQDKDPKTLARMIEHCERQKQADLAFWDGMIGQYRSQIDNLISPKLIA